SVGLEYLETTASVRQKKGVWMSFECFPGVSTEWCVRVWTSEVWGGEVARGEGDRGRHPHSELGVRRPSGWGVGRVVWGRGSSLLVVPSVCIRRNRSRGPIVKCTRSLS